jgi:ribonuclease HI
LGNKTTEAKPIGWQLAELNYNDIIREQVGLDIPPDVTEIMQNAFHIYTDGSFTGHLNYTKKKKHERERRPPNNTRAKAGWGVAIFQKGAQPSEEEDAVVVTGRLLHADATATTPGFDGTLRGRVTTTAEANAGANGHVGAARKTNNTAELQAVIEALLFLLAQVDAPRPMIDFHSHIVIHSDSKYAVGIIRDGARTNKNEVMANIMVHLWKRTKIAYDIRIVWVRGHSDNVGNKLADRIAAHGANEEINAERWSWRPRDWGYTEFRRDYPANYANQLSDRSFHHNADKNDQTKSAFSRKTKRDLTTMTEDNDANDNERAEVRRGQKGAPRIFGTAERHCGRGQGERESKAEIPEEPARRSPRSDCTEGGDKPTQSGW